MVFATVFDRPRYSCETYPGGALRWCFMELGKLLPLTEYPEGSSLICKFTITRPLKQTKTIYNTSIVAYIPITFKFSA